METRKYKQVPSITRIGGPNPRIPRPVIVNCGKSSKAHERIVARAVRTNSRAIGAGEPIDWDEVYR
ncbi:MAG: hypothetical protein IJ635_00540 [Bacteroidaceae bacterium]|nr:hypothetical protein [Bacteroidaceae bacterium]